MTTLWKDLIDIPEQVHKSDFVLKLSEGVTEDHREKTVRNYVVTPALADAFDRGLGLIKGSLAESSSMAAYLHGSFGSGKSHFMAVLNLLLSGYGKARELKGLAEVVAKHDWLPTKQLSTNPRGTEDGGFLLVPYHMIGARDMESAIFEGYVEHIQSIHPDAPIPGIYVADRILENAEKLREMMGEERFFEVLNAGRGGSSDGSSSGGGGRWGKKEASWTAESYLKASEARPGSPEKARLVGDLVGRVLTAMQDTAGLSEGGYVSLDEGLSILSHHAKSLGYDGLILFLDELILWLASHGGDIEFINREGPKLAKLVEAQHSDRPVPIISFVARQRDLREFVGDTNLGAREHALSQTLQWWEGRFETIALPDRDLPAIARERLLRPKGAEASELIRQSFDRTIQKMREVERDFMLTRDADLEMFRAVFPFSPVLAEALIALSAVLQRERTALRLMLTLLVRNRERLALGDMIRVGDLWDVINEGEEPTSDAIRQQFKSARTLWRNRLYPMLVEEKGIDPRQGEGDVHQRDAFENDARILKTLLMANLVPQVEAFREMTADKLIAVNYGSIRSPIPGGERSTLVMKLRQWASKVGELRMSEDANPQVRLQLSDVDLDGLLDRVKSQDNQGNRKRKVQSLLYGWLGLDDSNDLFTDLKVDWRGATRSLRVLYRNVREMPMAQIEAPPESWQIVIDYPFDEEEFTPGDDSANLSRFQQQYPEGTDTIAWLPAFLSAKGQAQLGRLVMVDYLLSRFDDYTSHVPPSDRPTVKTMLEGNQHAIRSNLRRATEVAYGIAHEDVEAVDHARAPATHLISLRHGHTPRLPGGKSFGDTLRDLAIEALQAKYPNAPKIADDALTRRPVEKMRDVVLEAIESPERRAFVEDKEIRRNLTRYLVPLKVGEMGETHFTWSAHWRDLIDGRLKEMEQGSRDRVTVSQLRKAIDPPDAPTAIPEYLQDLIITMYAGLENMVLTYGDQATDLEIGKLQGLSVLVRRDLPGEPAWERACGLLQSVFDVKPGRLRNARNVEKLARELRQSVESDAPAAKQIPEKLVEAGAHLGMTRAEVEETARHQTASLLCALLLAIGDDAAKTVESIAALRWESDDPTALKKQWDQARANLSLMTTLPWKTFGALQAHGTQVAAGLLEESRAVLSAREYVTPLAGLKDKEARGFEIIVDPVKPPPPPVVDVHNFRGDLTQIESWLRKEFGAATGEFQITVEKLAEKP